MIGSADAVRAGDQAGVVDADRIRLDRPGRVDGRVRPAAQQEPVISVGGTINPHDLAVVVKPEGLCRVAAGHVEGGVAAVVQQEAVNLARDLVADYLPAVVYVEGPGPGRPWEIDGAVTSPAQQEALIGAERDVPAWVEVVADDLAAVVDAQGVGLRRPGERKVCKHEPRPRLRQ